MWLRVSRMGSAGRGGQWTGEKGIGLMAKLIVENATVERVFQTQYGWGAAVYETYTPKDGGEEQRKRFTLWFDREPQLEVGQVVSASGFHAVKVRPYESNGETRHTADVSVRSARLIDAAPPIPPAPAEDDVWSTSDPWAANGGY